MGGAASNATTDIDVGENLLNQTDFNQMQIMSTNNIMSTVDTAKKSCSGNAAATQNAGISLIGSKIGKGANFVVGNINQTQTLNSNLGCIQKSVTENSMTDNISNAVQQQISTKFNTKAQAEIANLANAQAKSGALPLGVSIANTTSNTKYTVNSKNIINETLSNIVNNTIKQNFTNNDFEHCIDNIISTQNSGVYAENADIEGNFNAGNINQDQTLNFKQKCVQESKSISGTLSKIQNAFNTISKVSAETGIKTTIKAQSTAIARQKGIASIFGSFIFIIVIIVVLIIGVVIFGVYKFMSSGSSPDFSADVGDVNEANDVNVTEVTDPAYSTTEVGV
jgi:hypothetical protein